MARYRRIYAALTALMFAVIGCGGEDRGRVRPRAEPEIDASVDPCAADDEFEFLSIATFEPTSPEPQLPGWSASNDRTADDIQPPASPPAPPRTRLEIPRCGESEFGVRLYAIGLKVWGAGLGADLSRQCQAVSTAGGCDASAWEGLSFWARRNAEWTDDAGGAHQSGRSLFVAIADRYSHGKQGLCVWDHVRDAEKCDRFGVGVGLDTEWRFHAIRFADMTQRGFGKPSPIGQLDRELFDINFGLEAGDWDFWLDDVALFRARRADQ